MERNEAAGIGQERSLPGCRMNDSEVLKEIQPPRLAAVRCHFHRNALFGSALQSGHRIISTRGPASHGGTFDPSTALA